MKILVDTDIGSDIDDAICLSFLLKHPRAEILGITTVSGNAGTRAELASVLTCFHQVDVPIVVGNSEPVSGKQLQPEVPQASVLDSWPHSKIFQEIPAEDFLADRIRSFPGEVVLLSIGALTNISRLFQRHPDCVGKLGRLVSMSGRFSGYEGMEDVPEWNVLCDISAANSVYHTVGLRDVLYVGSDVTRRLVMRVEVATERLDVPCLAPVRDMARIWFAGRKKMTLHDALAGALVLDPSWCTYKRGRIELDTASGVTRWHDDDTQLTRVTDGVDVRGFFDHFFSFFSTDEPHTR